MSYIDFSKPLLPPSFCSTYIPITQPLREWITDTRHAPSASLTSNEALHRLPAQREVVLDEQGVPIDWQVFTRLLMDPLAPGYLNCLSTLTNTTPDAFTSVYLDVQACTLRCPPCYDHLLNLAKIDLLNNVVESPNQRQNDYNPHDTLKKTYNEQISSYLLHAFSGYLIDMRIPFILARPFFSPETQLEFRTLDYSYLTSEYVDERELFDGYREWCGERVAKYNARRISEGQPPENIDLSTSLTNLTTQFAIDHDGLDLFNVQDFIAERIPQEHPNYENWVFRLDNRPPCDLFFTPNYTMLFNEPNYQFSAWTPLKYILPLLPIQFQQEYINNAFAAQRRLIPPPTIRLLNIPSPNALMHINKSFLSRLNPTTQTLRVVFPSQPSDGRLHPQLISLVEAHHNYMVNPLSRMGLISNSTVLSIEKIKAACNSKVYTIKGTITQINQKLIYEKVRKFKCTNPLCGRSVEITADLTLRDYYEQGIKCGAIIQGGGHIIHQNGPQNDHNNNNNDNNNNNNNNNNQNRYRNRQYNNNNNHNNYHRPPNPTYTSKPCTGTFIKVNDFEKMQPGDIQTFQLTETSTIGSSGVPISVNVVLLDNFMNDLSIGDDVVVTGQVTFVWPHFAAGDRAVVDIQFVANNVSVLRTSTSSSASTIRSQTQNISKGTYAESLQHLLQYDIITNRLVYSILKTYAQWPLLLRTLLMNSIAPTLVGMSIHKLSMLLALVGGCECHKENKISLRGTLHMLMVGPPGVGKSHIMRAAAALAPRAIMTTGSGSSSAGLTVAARQDNATGRWTLDAGALVLASGGVCCIDEFGTMREHDRAAVHEAMEQQTVSIAKAGISTKVFTKTTIVAAQNPKKDNARPDAAEIKKGEMDGDAWRANHVGQLGESTLSTYTGVTAPLLSRFDIILVHGEPTPAQDRLIASTIMKTRFPIPTDTIAAVAQGVVLNRFYYDHIIPHGVDPDDYEYTPSSLNDANLQRLASLIAPETDIKRFVAFASGGAGLTPHTDNFTADSEYYQTYRSTSTLKLPSGVSPVVYLSKGYPVGVHQWWMKKIAHSTKKAQFQYDNDDNSENDCENNEKDHQSDESSLDYENLGNILHKSADPLKIFPQELIVSSKRPRTLKLFDISHSSAFPPVNGVKLPKRQKYQHIKQENDDEHNTFINTIEPYHLLLFNDILSIYDSISPMLSFEHLHYENRPITQQKQIKYVSNAHLIDHNDILLPTLSIPLPKPPGSDLWWSHPLYSRYYLYFLQTTVPAALSSSSAINIKSEPNSIVKIEPGVKQDPNLPKTAQEPRNSTATLESNSPIFTLNDVTQQKVFMPLPLLKRYISFVSQKKPLFNNTISSLIHNYYTMRRSFVVQHRKVNGGNSDGLTSIRLLEAIIRLTQAHAKLFCRDVCLLVDVITAISIVHYGHVGVEKYTGNPTVPSVLSYKDLVENRNQFYNVSNHSRLIAQADLPENYAFEKVTEHDDQDAESEMFNINMLDSAAESSRLEQSNTQGSTRSKGRAMRGRRAVNNTALFDEFDAQSTQKTPTKRAKITKKLQNQQQYDEYNNSMNENENLNDVDEIISVRSSKSRKNTPSRGRNVTNADNVHENHQSIAGRRPRSPSPTRTMPMQFADDGDDVDPLFLSKQPLTNHRKLDKTAKSSKPSIFDSELSVEAMLAMVNDDNDDYQPLAKETLDSDTEDSQLVRLAKQRNNHTGGFGGKHGNRPHDPYPPPQPPPNYNGFQKASQGIRPSHTPGDNAQNNPYEYHGGDDGDYHNNSQNNPQHSSHIKVSSKPQTPIATTTVSLHKPYKAPVIKDMDKFNAMRLKREQTINETINNDTQSSFLNSPSNNFPNRPQYPKEYSSQFQTVIPENRQQAGSVYQPTNYRTAIDANQPLNGYNQGNQHNNDNSGFNNNQYQIQHNLNSTALINATPSRFPMNVLQMMKEPNANRAAPEKFVSWVLGGGFDPTYHHPEILHIYPKMNDFTSNTRYIPQLTKRFTNIAMNSHNDKSLNEDNHGNNNNNYNNLDNNGEPSPLFAKETTMYFTTYLTTLEMMFLLRNTFQNHIDNLEGLKLQKNLAAKSKKAGKSQFDQFQDDDIDMSDLNNVRDHILSIDGSNAKNQDINTICRHYQKYVALQTLLDVNSNNLGSHDLSSNHLTTFAKDPMFLPLPSTPIDSTMDVSSLIPKLDVYINQFLTLTFDLEKTVLQRQIQQHAAQNHFQQQNLLAAQHGPNSIPGLFNPLLHQNNNPNNNGNNNSLSAPISDLERKILDKLDDIQSNIQALITAVLPTILGQFYFSHDAIKLAMYTSGLRLRAASLQYAASLNHMRLNALPTENTTNSMFFHLQAPETVIERSVGMYEHVQHRSVGQIIAEQMYANNNTQLDHPVIIETIANLHAQINAPYQALSRYYNSFAEYRRSGQKKKNVANRKTPTLNIPRPDPPSCNKPQIGQPWIPVLSKVKMVDLTSCFSAIDANNVQKSPGSTTTPGIRALSMPDLAYALLEPLIVNTLTNRPLNFEETHLYTHANIFNPNYSNETITAIQNADIQQGGDDNIMNYSTLGGDQKLTSTYELHTKYGLAYIDEQLTELQLAIDFQLQSDSSYSSNGGGSNNDQSISLSQRFEKFQQIRLKQSMHDQLQQIKEAEEAKNEHINKSEEMGDIDSTHNNHQNDHSDNKNDNHTLISYNTNSRMTQLSLYSKGSSHHKSPQQSTQFSSSSLQPTMTQFNHDNNIDMNMDMPPCNDLETSIVAPNTITPKSSKLTFNPTLGQQSTTFSGPSDIPSDMSHIELITDPLELQQNRSNSHLKMYGVPIAPVEKDTKSNVRSKLDFDESMSDSDDQTSSKLINDDKIFKQSLVDQLDLTTPIKPGNKSKIIDENDDVLKVTSVSTKRSRLYSKNTKLFNNPKNHQNSGSDSDATNTINTGSTVTTTETPWKKLKHQFTNNNHKQNHNHNNNNQVATTTSTKPHSPIHRAPTTLTFTSIIDPLSTTTGNSIHNSNNRNPKYDDTDSEYFSTQSSQSMNNLLLQNSKCGNDLGSNQIFVNETPLQKKVILDTPNVSQNNSQHDSIILSTRTVPRVPLFTKKNVMKANSSETTLVDHVHLGTVPASKGIKNHNSTSGDDNTDDDDNWFSLSTKEHISKYPLNPQSSNKKMIFETQEIPKRHNMSFETQTQEPQRTPMLFESQESLGTTHLHEKLTDSCMMNNTESVQTSTIRSPQSRHVFKFESDDDEEL